MDEAPSHGIGGGSTPKSTSTHLGELLVLLQGSVRELLVALPVVCRVRVLVPAMVAVAVQESVLQGGVHPPLLIPSAAALAVLGGRRTLLPVGLLVLPQQGAKVQLVDLNPLVKPPVELVVVHVVLIRVLHASAVLILLLLGRRRSRQSFVPLVFLLPFDHPHGVVFTVAPQAHQPRPDLERDATLHTIFVQHWPCRNNNQLLFLFLRRVLIRSRTLLLPIVVVRRRRRRRRRRSGRGALTRTDLSVHLHGGGLLREALAARASRGGFRFQGLGRRLGAFRILLAHRVRPSSGGRLRRGGSVPVTSSLALSWYARARAAVPYP